MKTMITVLLVLCLATASFAGILIQWDANSTTEAITEYRIYRNGKHIARTPATSIVFGTISTGRPYRYNITAVNATAESGFSNPVDIVMPSIPVNAKITIQWEVK